MTRKIVLAVLLVAAFAVYAKACVSGPMVLLNELTTEGLDVGDAGRAKGGRYYLYTGDTRRSIIIYEKRPSRNIRFFEIRLPHDQAWGISVQVIKIGTKAGDWTGEKRVALARRLLNKRLPSGHTRCTSKHYKDYIYFGTIYKSKTLTACPLNRPLEGVTLAEINSPEFYLVDGAGNQIVVAQLQSYTNPQELSPAMSPDANRSDSSSSCGDD